MTARAPRTKAIVLQLHIPSISKQLKVINDFRLVSNPELISTASGIRRPELISLFDCTIAISFFSRLQFHNILPSTNINLFYLAEIFS